jgi:hypothetical protein
MYPFLHKHRYWFLALILLTVGALIYFQFRDDGGTVPGLPRQSTTGLPGAPIQPNSNNIPDSNNIPGMPIQPSPAQTLP